MITLVMAFDPFGFLAGIPNMLINFVIHLVVLLVQGILALLQTFWLFIQVMPLGYTVNNPVVMQSWHVMTSVADALLGLFVLLGVLQILYGQATRSLEMPLPQFLGRAFLTILLIHLSAFFGETVLLLNNEIAAIVALNVGTFVHEVFGPQGPSLALSTLFGAIIALVFAVGLLRLAIQGVKRIVLFNLLFVLSGPAFLLSFHPYTQPVFSAWARRFLATSFEQSIQFLGLGLGIQFLTSTGQTGITGLVIAIAMMNLAAEIPTLVSQLVTGGSSIGLRDNGLASVAIGAFIASRFL